jgi:AcrR family transcriptional regulator
MSLAVNFSVVTSFRERAAIVLRMSLRERKAAQTRRRMVDVAIALFERDGYEATKMETIAEQAEVGTTTLYRYFPSKELLLLDQFADVLDCATRLRARPDTEPLDVALGEVLLDVARTVDDPQGGIASLRSLIDSSPGPRAKLWDYFLQAREQLAVAIAEREGRLASDLGVRATAAMTLELLQIVDAISAQNDPPPSHVGVTKAVLDELSRATIHFPVLPAAS